MEKTERKSDRLPEGWLKGLLQKGLYLLKYDWKLIFSTDKDKRQANMVKIVN